jgi:hypothetical protein
MPINSVVLNVPPVAEKPNRFGLIVVPRSMAKITAVNGKNFIAVAVAVAGGDGVAIALLLPLNKSKTICFWKRNKIQLLTI